MGALAHRHGVGALTSYYAIVVQDLDRLGRRMGELSCARQRAASNVLTELGRGQLSAGQGAPHLGIPIYAGGDDFLAFAPAATALDLATAVRLLTRDRLAGSDLRDTTATTAVVFTHMTSSMQQAIATAQAALTRAKDAVGRGGATRDALSVVVIRRGGERARMIQPWRTDPAAAPATELLARVVPARDAASLSARLAARLEQDRDELDSLGRNPHRVATLREEVVRLVERQGGDRFAAEALCALGGEERSRAGIGFDALPAALVARFLAQECR